MYLQIAIHYVTISTEVMEMATRTANVMARVEPNVKSQAESILEDLGVPSSTVINALYKQIIYTRSIPFDLSVPSVPAANITRASKNIK